MPLLQKNNTLSKWELWGNIHQWWQNGVSGATLQDVSHRSFVSMIHSSLKHNSDLIMLIVWCSPLSFCETCREGAVEACRLRCHKIYPISEEFRKYLMKIQLLRRAYQKETRLVHPSAHSQRSCLIDLFLFWPLIIQRQTSTTTKNQGGFWTIWCAKLTRPACYGSTYWWVSERRYAHRIVYVTVRISKRVLICLTDSIKIYRYTIQLANCSFREATKGKWGQVWWVVWWTMVTMSPCWLVGPSIEM